MSDAAPLIERVIFLTAESMARWARFRPDRSDIAYAGLNDLGRILWVVRFYEIDTVDDLLDAERRRLLSLDAFGVALRAMSADVEFAFANCAAPSCSEPPRLGVPTAQF